MEKSFPGSTYYASEEEDITEHPAKPADRLDEDITESEINIGLAIFMSDASEHSRSRVSISRGNQTNLKLVMRNLTKAILDFSVSELSAPYLEQMQKHDEKNLRLDRFYEYINTQKEYLGYSKSLKELVVYGEGETEQEVLYKRVFKKIAVIFLKFFVVNWIFQSRIRNKDMYLRLRFKVLRMIQNLN